METKQKSTQAPPIIPNVMKSACTNPEAALEEREDVECDRFRGGGIDGGGGGCDDGI